MSLNDSVKVLHIVEYTTVKSLALSSWAFPLYPEKELVFFLFVLSVPPLCEFVALFVIISAFYVVEKKEKQITNPSFCVFFLSISDLSRNATTLNQTAMGNKSSLQSEFKSRSKKVNGVNVLDKQGFCDIL